MKFRSLFPLAAAICLLVGISTGSTAQSIEQRYAVRWDVEPIARFSMDRNLYVNGARCRIDEGRYKDRWLNGRATGSILGKTTWRIGVQALPPGTYNVTFDLRTPTGAEWIPGLLRVPQIARHTGFAGNNLRAPTVWPQDSHDRIECDRGPVEFAWDRDNLYIRPAAGSPGRSSIEMDLVPCVQGKRLKQICVSGVTTVPWNDLFPAAPMTGQVLRYQLRSDFDASRYPYLEGTASRQSDGGDWTDLLFVGTGMDMYFGATVVSHGPGGDDQGPPRPVLDALVDLSGLDCRSSGVSWGGVEWEDPGDGESVYHWSGLLADADLYKHGLTYCHIDLHNPWADEIKDKDPDRYWRLAEDFVSEAARRYASVGVRYFSLGYNEPECFFRTDKEDFFNEQLTHLANAVHRAVPDARVIAGKFSSGDPNLIRQFYAHGFRHNFDVMDIHPYNNDPLTGCAMGEVVASHEALDELGMGHKRIFLGEGWGPTRDLKQVVRTQWDEPVSPEEADVTRQFYQNGYRCLVSARADYCPDWVLGAKYFTLNDNVGGTYWKQAAKPVKNEKGEVMYYLIGELRFGDPETFKAFFCNGGLVDFFGEPKGQWFYDFPPVLPEVRVLATGGPDYVLPGEWHKIDIPVVNANPRPITDLRLGVRERTGKFKGAITAERLGPYTLPSLAPGETWRTAARVRLDSADPGRLRIALEVQYQYDGENHISDDVISTQIRAPLAVTMDPARVVLDGSPTAPAIAVRVQNNARQAITLRPARGQRPGLSLMPSKQSLRIPSGGTGALTLSLRPDKPEPGVTEVAVAEGANAALTVAVPLKCPKVKAAVTVDGDLSDWPKSQVAAGAIRFGSTVGAGARPMDDPFPEPPPVKSSAIGATPAHAPAEDKTATPTFGANAAAAWDEGAFYLTVMVEDETFQQEYSGIEVWRQDSVQLAFDPLLDGPANIRPDGGVPDAYGPDDYEMALAQTGKGPQVVTIRGPRGTPTGVRSEAALAVRRDGRCTIYEARIPWSLLHGVTPRPGCEFGFDILVNNFEGEDRYTLGWANGIANGKFPARFVPVVLD